MKKWMAACKVFLSLWVCLCTTGCWDRLEIEQRATVLGLSFDIQPENESGQAGQGANGQGGPDTQSPQQRLMQGNLTAEAAASEPQEGGKQGQIRLTAQIAVPGRIPLGPGQEGGGGAGTNPRQAVWVVSSFGPNVTEALQHLQLQVADPLFYGHLRVIVVSRAFAERRGLSDLMDYLRRNPQVRRTLWIVVSQHLASTLMATAPPLERVPTLYLISTMDQAIRMGKFPNEFLGTAESKAVMKGREMVLPYVDVRNQENLLVQGLAYFRDYRMVGATDTKGIYAYMELAGIRRAGFAGRSTLPDGSWVVAQGYRRRRSVRLRIIHNKPQFDVYVHIDSKVKQTSGGPLNMRDPRTIAMIERVQARQIIGVQRRLIQNTQRAGSDIVGFGEFVRGLQPDWWNQHVRTKDRWQEIYKTLPVHLHVDVRLHEFGMRAR
ncbi:Ger(x)C family spore germination protein [Alicyclobacillus herbarius]|uniref:Ger(x)C family spore germination protein n=1 Tax=Alicyclobacillus herbarius TaxID=122960 RepID=UPI0009D6DE30|nr:Ger(x)C family spore germination protein [Alicyclobacillus herbarius]